jgi:RNA polymerase sigma factor (sigma-70 family)
MVDEEAMLAVSKGDLDKAAILYERYKKPVLGYFYRNSVRNETAEDLMQQVFFRVINYRKNYGEGYTFKPWLFRIARNVLQDAVQKHKIIITELDEKFDLQLEENQHHAEQEDQLRAALDKLPGEYREVILLSRYEELKYQEIADILQISVSLVKVRVHRGLKILREIYFQME